MLQCLNKQIHGQELQRQKATGNTRNANAAFLGIPRKTTAGGGRDRQQQKAINETSDAASRCKLVKEYADCAGSVGLNVQ